jgi:hypothetical protein
MTHTSEGKFRWYAVNITEAPDCERISRNDYMPTVVTDNTWHEFVQHVRFGWTASQNPKFELWIDGVKQTFEINGQTVSVDTRPNTGYMTMGPFLRMGIYAHQSQRQGVYIDKFTAARQISGQTDAQAYAEVSPSGGSTNTPPTISITIDGGTSTVTDTAGNSHNFQSTASDNGTVDSIYWHMGGCYADQTVEDPGALTLSTVATCDVYATATDNLGATADSNHISVVIGSPTISGLVHRMQFGDDTSVATDSEGNTDFDINENSVSGTSGSNEPDPPGYGTYEATFNGTNQAIGWDSTTYNANAPWQAGQTSGTIIEFGTTPSSWTSDNMYGPNMWGQTTNERVFGRVWAANNGSPIILYGTGTGSTGEACSSTYSLPAGSQYKLAYSIEGGTSYAVHGRLYQGGQVVDDWNCTMSGPINTTNRPAFIIGRRADGAYKYQGGGMSHMEVYNTVLSSPQMDSRAGLATSSGDSSVTVDTGSGTPQILLETGDNDLVCSYVSGSGTDTLIFQGTVSAASGHNSATPVQITSATIDENGGSIGGTGAPYLIYAPHTGQTLGDGETVTVLIEFAGTSAVSLTLPTEGTEGSLSYQSPFYIDTTSGSISSTCISNSAGTCIAADTTYYLSDKRAYLKVTFSDGQWVANGGAYGNVAIPVILDSGHVLLFRYLSGAGTGTWMFYADIQPGMRERGGLVLSAVGDMMLDYLGGSAVTIQDAAGNALSSTDLPSTDLDTHVVKIDATAGIRTKRSASGAITIRR